MPTNVEEATGTRTTQREELRHEALALLPAPDATSDTYERHLDRLFADREATTQMLVAVLAELWRRLDVVTDASSRRGAEAAAGRVETELISRHSQRQLEQLEQRDRAEPLRRRLLYGLASRGSTPTALAASVSASKEAVSRTLAKLEEEGLVEAQADPDDRRRRVYSLTHSGGIARREQMALPVAEVEDQRVAATRPFLEGAISEAVERRRHANDLLDAVERFRRIKSEARKANAWDIELRARRELATTLRQASLSRDFDSEVREMAEIARGHDPRVDSNLMVPAHGHVAYELGRQGGDNHEEHLIKRVISLLAASEIFGTLSRDGVPGDNWRSRQAWALFGLGDARRRQTQFGHALADATKALRLFTELEDSYGAASSLLLAGGCLRLRGQFAESLAVLDLACARTSEGRFFRLHADSLMQLGEINRSLGRLDQAETLLNDAIARADGLRSVVTAGFARSSLAATLYERGRYDDAKLLFAEAQSLFAEHEHHAGLALNMHRQAILQRSLQSAQHVGTDEARDLLRRTRHSYGRLKSPAGIVACYIEEGRLALEAGRRLTGGWRRRLFDWITPITRRELLEKDPWVPTMLTTFAQALGDEQLIALSRTVATGSADRQLARQEEWVNANAVFAVSVSSDLTRKEPDSMAGEHRRLVSALP